MNKIKDLKKEEKNMLQEKLHNTPEVQTFEMYPSKVFINGDKFTEVNEAIDYVEDEKRKRRR